MWLNGPLASKDQGQIWVFLEALEKKRMFVEEKVSVGMDCSSQVPVLERQESGRPELRP